MRILKSKCSSNQHQKGLKKPQKPFSHTELRENSQVTEKHYAAFIQNVQETGVGKQV